MGMKLLRFLIHEGEVWATCIVALVSVGVSLLITWVGLELSGIGFTLPSALIAIIAPLLIAPPITILVFRATLALREARYDWLCEVFNEQYFLTHCRRELSPDRDCMIAYLSVDKQIELEADESGPFATIQQAWAQHISGFLGDDWVIARVGSGRFGLAKDNAADSDAELLERLRGELSDTAVMFDGLNVAPTASCGIVFYEKDKNVFEKLLSKASSCVELAQKQGGNKSVSLTMEMESEILDHAVRQVTPALLSKALFEGKVFFHQQKIIDTRTGDTFAKERLIRTEIDGEIRTPAAFLKTYYVLTQSGGNYSRSGLIIDHLREAAPLNDGKIFVNLEEFDLMSGTLDLILEYCEGAELAERVCFELVEKSVFDNLSSADISQVVEKIHSVGCLVALDDFGKDNSNLARLAQADFDFVKIDKEITRRYRENGAMYIMLSLKSLSNSLGFSLIAEGIESEAQSKWFTDLGITLQQGYYWGKPV